jgi:hypothetical protein
MNRTFDFLYRQCLHIKQRLTQIRDTPHAIAGGVAIGFVIGFTPLIGFKTVVAVLLAWLFRCSKLSAALSVNFHDALLPVWPVILRWEFQVGYFLTSHPHRLPPKLVSLKHFHFENFLNMNTVPILWKTFVGSVVLTIPLAVGIYFLVLGIVTKAQAARARAAAHAAAIQG